MFGTFLKAARERADLTINELGRMADVDAGYLSRLERDLVNPPTPEIITKLAPALKVPRNDLMYAAGYIDLPGDIKAAGVGYVALSDEYIAKGLSEEQIRRILDSVVDAVKGKDVG